MLNAYNIILMIACYFTSNFIYAPSLDLVASDLGVSNELVKATMSSYQFGALVSCITAAFFADYFGKKNFLVFGLTLATLGSVICMLAPDIETLIIGRVIQGFGGATGFMMGFALAVDLFKPEITIKIIALNGIITSFVSIFTPNIGGVISEYYSWRGTFLIMVPLFSITLLISYLHLPVQSNLRSPQLNLGRSLSEVGTILTSVKYLAYATLNGIFLAGFIFSASFLPFYLGQSFSLNAIEIGMIIGLGMWLSFGFASRLSPKFYESLGVDKSIKLGLIMSLFGGVGMLMTSYLVISNFSLSMVITAVVTYSLGFGLMYAGSISKCMRIFDNLTTKASAIRTIMLTVGSFVGALAAQNMSDQILSNLAIIYISSAIVGILMFSIRGKA